MPLSSGPPLTLVRRDLFDARFQLISEDEYGPHANDQPHPAGASALEFIEAPSDLVPGVYEGGLKTWECSLDIVNYLDVLADDFTDTDIRGKRLLEVQFCRVYDITQLTQYQVGCGTSIPSLYILHRLFSSSITTSKYTQLHLQDYNDSVLEFVSFPNIFLTWCMCPCITILTFVSSQLIDPDMSALAAPFREPQRTDVGSTEAQSPLNPSTPSEFLITPELKSAFLLSLHERNISLRFFSGSWDSFNVSATGGKYDIVLTSETIYRTEYLPSLIKLLRTACGCGEEYPLLDAPSYLCIVAAKVIYFGVGGGVAELLNAVHGSGDHDGAKAELVWESKTGVARQILRMYFDTS